MTLRSYLLGLWMITIILLVAWLIIITSIDPETSGTLGQVLFYVTFFSTLAGIYTLLFIWLWRRAMKDRFSAIEVSIAFREGILIAILTTIFTIFQQVKIFTWWSALLVVAGILLIELYFLSFKRETHNKNT